MDNCSFSHIFNVKRKGQKKHHALTLNTLNQSNIMLNIFLLMIQCHYSIQVMQGKLIKINHYHGQDLLNLLHLKYSIVLVLIGNEATPITKDNKLG